MSITGFVYPQEEAEEWAIKYGLEIKSCACQNCGVTLWTTIPFASKFLRGLIAPTCDDCGNESTPFTYIKWKRK